MERASRERHSYRKQIAEIKYFLRSKDMIQGRRSKAFIATGKEKNPAIFIYGNIEYMGALHGHEKRIECLATLLEASDVLASESGEMIKVWEMKRRSVLFTLSVHIHSVSALCYMR